MEDFEKGAKRKCTSCSTLFFDFGKFPTICPNCGSEVTTLLTNVSKRGRPPKSSKVEEVEEIENVVEHATDNNENSVKIEEIEENISEDDGESVEDMIEIKREEE